MEEIFNKYDQLIPNYEISALCLTTYPCKHYVIKNGIKTIKSSIEIYSYCIKHNIEVPEHFIYCKKICDKNAYLEMIKNNDFENFKNNYLLDEHGLHFDNYSKIFLSNAISFNKIKFVKYLVEDKNIPIEYEHISKSINLPNMEIFKYLLQKSNYDPKSIGKINYLGRGGNNLLSLATHHKNFQLIKYPCEELDVQLNQNNKYTSALSELRCYDPLNENDIDIANYLIQKSIEQNVIYYGDDVLKIKKMGFYDILSSKNLIYNPYCDKNIEIEFEHMDVGHFIPLLPLDEYCKVTEKEFECSLSESIKDRLINNMVCVGQLHKIKSILEYNIENLIHHNLLINPNNNIIITNVPFCCIKYIEISIKTNIEKAINNIFIDFNGSSKPFNKYENENKFIFNSKVPIPINCLMFTTIKIIVEINDGIDKIHNDLFIKNINFKMRFVPGINDRIFDKIIQIDDFCSLMYASGLAVFIDNQLHDECIAIDI